MSAKRFEYEGHEWEAQYDGIGVGVASGFIPRADHFSFTFRCVSDPKQPTVRGHLRDSNPNSVSDAALKRALNKALAKGKAEPL